MSLPKAAYAIAAALVLAGLLQRAALLAPHAAVAVDLRQPIAVVTNWHALGATFFAALLAALALATAAYLPLLRRTEPMPIAPALAAIALALAAAWTLPAIFSSDVYAYAAYGELLRLGANPYGHHALPHGDAIFAATIWQWGNPPPACVYGPVFVALCALLVAVAAPLGTLAQLDLLRVAASLALLLCAWLAYRAYPGDRAARANAALLIGLNPVAVWCAAEGHNDALALAAILGGFALLRAGRPAAGAALAALSGAIKLPGIAAAWAAVRADRRALPGAIAGSLAALALCAPVLAGAAQHLAPHGRYAPQASLQALLEPLLLLVLGDRAATAATIVLACAAAATVAVPALRALNRGEPAGWAQLGLAAWLLVPNPYPWYALWLLPAAALAPRSRAALAVIWLGVASLLRYVPDAVGVPGPLAGIALGIAATLPVLWAALPNRSAILSDSL